MEFQHAWFVQVDNEVNFNDPAREKQIEEMLWKQRSIYKLPASVTDLNKKAYTPQVISFGPYHCNDETLRPMEEQKDRLLRRFLTRSRKRLQFYFDLLAKEKDCFMDAYYPRWSHHENEFLSIMVRDGCCMLEILQSYTDDYASNDPIFSEHGRDHFWPYIQRDMLILENQLPMRVLETLLEQSKEFNSTEDLEAVNQLVWKFFFPEPALPLGRCEHVLDLYRKVLLGEYKLEPHVQTGAAKEMQPIIPRGDHKDDKVIRPAKELYEAGIRIQKSTKSNFRDIKFDPNTGILTVPGIVVDDATEPLFLNLLTFERFHVGAKNWVTAYVFFMDSIIDDAEDINLLHSNKIVRNAFGSDEAAAKLFNSLPKEVALGNYDSVEEEIKKVNEYCKRWWPRWRSYFFRTYWRNPWVLVSVIAATVLFILTVIQTIYTVMSYEY